MISSTWLKSKIGLLKNMECPDKEKCYANLQVNLDNEGTEEEIKQFRLQMKHCKPCIDRFQVDHALKYAIQTRVEKLVPPKVLEELIQVQHIL